MVAGREHTEGRRRECFAGFSKDDRGDAGSARIVPVVLTAPAPSAGTCQEQDALHDERLDAMLEQFRLPLFV